ncbi:hypothetical protein PDESU_06272 [Pontiella desulfatans]|uniref:Uncharacterized protein n=1 Tax=Pontiella desulfatans TaxID=2750659 RepID=A0A6C2UC41_PONDE|nr:hypothetical protein [Pontiella desulfatans]VGO17670.1 hypothetical protein PDESU_06272 [Pontiella desulfatans]
MTNTLIGCDAPLMWLESSEVKPSRQKAPSVELPDPVLPPAANQSLTVPALDHEDVPVIVDMLQAIPATDEDPWWRVTKYLVYLGIKLFDDPYAFSELWDEWSKSDMSNYDVDKNLEKWGRFEEEALAEGEFEFDPLEGLMGIARDHGWVAQLVDDRPMLIVSSQVSSRQVQDAAEIVGAQCAASGKIYRRGRVVDEVCFTGSRYELYPVTQTRSVSLFEELCAPHTEKAGKDGEAVLVPCKVSTSLASSLLSCPAMFNQLEELKVVLNCSVLATDVNGKLIEVHSGQYTGGILAGGLPVDMPSSLTEARERIDFLLADYKFETKGDKARAVASILEGGFVFGGLLGGRTVMAITEADLPGAGKSYRNDITAAVYNEDLAVIAQKGSGIGGAEEALDTALVDGSRMISLDNTRGKIDSQRLESLLTSDRYAARPAYSRTTQVDPSRALIMMTSNRAELTPDLLRRSSIVKILKRDDYVFREFPEGDLVQHVRANYQYYLGAVYYVIKEWDRRGRPCPKDTRHSFRRWAGVLGYCVKDILGYADMLADYDKVERRMDSKELTWLRNVLGKLVPVLDPQTKYTTSQLIDELLEVEPELIPGYSGDCDPEVCRDTREKLNRAMGRRLKKAMDKELEVRVDGLRFVQSEVLVPRRDGKGNRAQKAFQLTKLS